MPEEKTQNAENGSIQESDIEKVSFENVIDDYIKHLSSLSRTFPHIETLVALNFLQSYDEREKFIKEKTEKKPHNNDEDSKEGQKILIKLEDHDEYEHLENEVSVSKIAFDIIPINFVLSLVSQFDAYLGNIIKTIFEIRPELINSSEKNIQFSDLIDFESIKDAKDYIVEKEIESVLRENHLKQFKWLEQRIGIKLREDLPNFKLFIEVTERRNLFAHNNGIINRQYIESCKDQQLEGIDKIKRGNKLKASSEYVRRTYSILYEIGVKLGHVLWRKLLPNDLRESDIHLNNICYDLMVQGKYKLAMTMLKFATETLKKHHDLELKCTMVINKALIFYLTEKKIECQKTLDALDWSLASDKFHLAISILREDYNSAVKYMKNIGAEHTQVNKLAYREWPLFKKFRETQEFKETYKNIFDEEYVIVERRPKNLQNIVNYIKEVEAKVSKDSIEKKTK